MTVIVYDGHLGRMFVVQLLGSFSLQQEVLIHKVLHVGICLIVNFLDFSSFGRREDPVKPPFPFSRLQFSMTKIVLLFVIAK
jgi:hypothetical protein